MTEADILAMTYVDSCEVRRLRKSVQPYGETVLRPELVCKSVRCALSSPQGGKITRSAPAATAPTDYKLFVRPEVDIMAGDRVTVWHMGHKIETIAGRPERHVSHSNIPLQLAKEAV